MVLPLFQYKKRNPLLFFPALVARLLLNFNAAMVAFIIAPELINIKRDQSADIS